MKKITFFLLLLVSCSLAASSQVLTGNSPQKALKPTLGIVLYSNDAETVWNAFRLANFSAGKGDTVAVFLLGKGVEALIIEDKNFDIKQQAETFVTKGGQVLSCGSCVRMRKDKVLDQCPISNLGTLYEIISNSKRIVTF